MSIAEEMSRNHRRNILVKMFNEQGGVCPYCSEPMTLTKNFNNTATIEHIRPKSKGGSNDHENLMAACYSCNQDRGNQLLSIFLIERGLHGTREKDRGLHSN